MNFAQRIILIIAFLAIAAMAIFPPWVYVHDAPRYKRIERPAGYHLISGDHTPQDITQLAKLFGLRAGEWETQLQFFAIRLDGTRLLVQVSLTLLLTLILFFILKSRTVVR